MTTVLDKDSPVVIGGVGGSGTRLFASILQESNFYIGNQLNWALDNRWFTRLVLLENPKLTNDKKIVNNTLKNWYSRIINNPKLLQNRFKIFKLLMTSSKKSDLNQFITNFKLYEDKKKNEKLASIIFHNQLPNEIKSKFWGWKQPNSHLFLNDILHHFPNFKYIHTIRNGLDMVFSENQSQLKKFKHLYDIPNEDTPSNRLEYWIKANNKTIELGEKLLREKFYLLNFDKFVLNKKDELKKLLTFLKIKTSEKEFNLLVSLIKKPNSIGRHKEFNINFFSKIQLRGVKTLGFTI